ncbi:rhomboid family intramembrane serine protease [Haloglomus litoreum]|uniref:rhomboid family intramembrane serine protease n=1 Tax=Haloglomus litoreum TaxID=3034026 RepID=UPI0023E75CEE|nr:rhomboid family intramembrane serine protease [Haloglomus sp. DT116]
MARARPFESYSVTTGLALVLLLVWLVVSVLASGAGKSVPTYLESQGAAGRILIFLFGPLIHQGVDLLLGNLLFLLAIGPFVESRVGWRQYLLFIALAGYALTVLAYLLGMATVGISGVTHALTGREAGARLGDLSGAIGTSPVETLVVALVFIYQISQLPAGGSIVAHAGGLVLGFLIAVGVATDYLEQNWLEERIQW